MKSILQMISESKDPSEMNKSQLVDLVSDLENMIDKKFKFNSTESRKWFDYSDELLLSVEYWSGLDSDTLLHAVYKAQEILGINESKSDDGDGKVESKEELEGYAEAILSKAHGDDYDQEKMKKFVSDLIEKHGEDWDKLSGIIQNSVD